jgi:hypothetical protein
MIWTGEEWNAMFWLIIYGRPAALMDPSTHLVLAVEVGEADLGGVLERAVGLAPRPGPHARAHAVPPRQPRATMPGQLLPSLAPARRREKRRMERTVQPSPGGRVRRLFGKISTDELATSSGHTRGALGDGYARIDRAKEMRAVRSWRKRKQCCS